jgi:uncharacterized BrkB/YihY/UPF0761 family membrane protein
VQLAAILGILSLVFSGVVYFVLPTRSFFFLSFAAVGGPVVSCLLTIISYGAAAALKAAAGDVYYDLAFSTFVFAWVLFIVAGVLYGLAFLKKRSEVQASSNARRNVAEWAVAATRPKRKRRRRKRD